MTSSTHIIASTITVCTFNILLGKPLHPTPIAIAAFTSLLPDLDHPSSQVSRLCKPMSRFIFRKFGRRNLTHSMLGWILAGIVFWPLKWIQINVPLYTPAMIGYISHTILDMANLEGVALTHPIAPHQRWVFPYEDDHRIKVGSTKERMLRIIGLVIMTGLVTLNLADGKSIFHSFLGTPDAIARDYVYQLMTGHRLVVRVNKGVWTLGQGRVREEFDVIGSTNRTIFVQRASEPLKVYQISDGESSSISHPRLEIVRRIRAEQRIVKVQFKSEKWHKDLILQYPNAIVSGKLVTRAKPPVFKIDEFPTIQQFDNEYRWELKYAPLARVAQWFKESNAKITGEIQLRYWQERE